MEPNNNLREAIQKIFNEESANNSFSSEYFVQKGINPNDLLVAGEVALTKEMNEEEELLKKLIYDSIVAKSANDLALYKILNDEILEYCDVTENQTLINKYIDLLIKFGG